MHAEQHAKDAQSALRRMRPESSTESCALDSVEALAAAQHAAQHAAAAMAIATCSSWVGDYEAGARAARAALRAKRAADRCALPRFTPTVVTRR